MIKVQRLINPKLQHSSKSIQTTFPHLSTSKYSYHFQPHSKKKCNEKQNMAKWNTQLKRPIKNQVFVNKNFKFLFFDEQITKIAIKKYLKGLHLTKYQISIMTSSIQLPYISRATSQITDTNQIIKKNIQSSVIKTNLTSIVKIVKSIICSQSLTLQNINKVCKLALAIKNQKKCFTLSTQDSALQPYCLAYIKNCSQNQCTQTLMQFYQKIYDQYQKIPFREQFQQQEQKNTNQQIIFCSNQQNEVTKLPIQPTNKNTFDDSFIKLRFYDNLRKQIKQMGEDTDKIINNQMGKHEKRQ